MAPINLIVYGNGKMYDPVELEEYLYKKAIQLLNTKPLPELLMEFERVQTGEKDSAGQRLNGVKETEATALKAVQEKVSKAEKDLQTAQAAMKADVDAARYSAMPQHEATIFELRQKLCAAQLEAAEAEEVEAGATVRFLEPVVNAGSGAVIDGVEFDTFRVTALAIVHECAQRLADSLRATFYDEYRFAVNRLDTARGKKIDAKRALEATQAAAKERYSGSLNRFAMPAAPAPIQGPTPAPAPPAAPGFVPPMPPQPGQLPQKGKNAPPPVSRDGTYEWGQVNVGGRG